MADEILPEVTVSGQNQPAIKKPPSAWKVGLLYTLIGGPFAGLATGIIQHSRNKSYLEKEAAAQDERKSLTNTIDNELKIADPDEKRLLDYAKGLKVQAYEYLATGQTKQGQQLLDHSRQLVEQIMTGDISQRKQDEAAKGEFQRGLIGDAAKGYHQEFQNTRDSFNGIDRQASMVLDLVAQPDFDPNAPLNKAHLAELLSMGGLMFKDTPDLAEGFAQSVGAVSGIAGGLAGGLATALKSQDFKVTPEMYNRLALNTKKYAEVFANKKIGELQEQGTSLDEWSKKLGIIPQDYSMWNYISGGEKELKMLPAPKFTGGFRKADDTREVKTPTGTLLQKRVPTGWRTGAREGDWWDPANWVPNNDSNSRWETEAPKRPTN